ncbi:MAG: maleylpyruvate isomerase family mycothiol-dependent enzyme [Acidimicrobiia bacterium]|nr:maleylpyruvate isomerase family mycothiol-dependent enzyme [Acidimicrobiia bacterium]
MGEYDDIIQAQREMLLEDLKTFTDEEWAAPTVCDPWTPRQLVAHLTSLNQQTRWNFVKGLLANRFDFDAFLAADMRRLDVGSNADILAAFERTVKEARPIPLPKMVPPTETMIHADDIRRATGRPRRVYPEHVRPFLEPYMKSGAPVRGKKRAEGLSFRATDIDWSAGTGPEVVGPAFDLLLAIGGRGDALDYCEGDGVEILRSRCRQR